MYGFILFTICKLGFKKLAVRTAYFMENRNSKLFEAAQAYLYGGETGLPWCSECFLPILTDSDKKHEPCRAAIQQRKHEEDLAWDEHLAELDAEEEARMARYHYDELMDSFCTEPGCYKPGDGYDGKCSKHEPEDICYSCGKPESQCICTEDDDRDICDGICGQPAYACTCAELASFRRYNATPLEERCGPWTA